MPESARHDPYPTGDSWLARPLLDAGVVTQAQLDSVASQGDGRIWASVVPSLLINTPTSLAFRQRSVT